MVAEATPPLPEAARAVSRRLALGAMAGGATLLLGAAPRRLDRSWLRPAFADDFANLRLVQEGGPWKSDYGWGGEIVDVTSPQNGERQVYGSPAFSGSAGRPLGLDPFSIRDGVLHITASPVPDDLRRYVWDYPFVSGLITTRQSFVQRHGYFEMRARLPKGRGLWPAFWLLPDDGNGDEIDVMEVLGHDPTTLWTTVHGRSVFGRVEIQDGVKAPDLSAAFHTFGVLWTAETITWFLDEMAVFSARTPRGFSRPMYMLVNLAVGGHWPGLPDAGTRFPATLSVNWVRAWALRS